MEIIIELFCEANQATAKFTQLPGFIKNRMFSVLLYVLFTDAQKNKNHDHRTQSITLGHN